MVLSVFDMQKDVILMTYGLPILLLRIMYLYIDGSMASQML